jgi:hypothetical protein
MSAESRAASNPELEVGEKSWSPREWLLRGKPAESLARGFE